MLLIDATALIEALAEKIEQVKNGELTLNRELADAVAGSVAPPKAPSRIPGDPSTLNLNREQQNAYFRALEASVTWIMGPPGCGKTMTLGQIVRAAFEGKRRVLVCSNTNKAVDQLLYRVCHSLGTEHDAMENGQVVRLGRIADDRLRDEYAQYVTVDGIVERRSRELNRRRVDIDVQIARIDSRTKRAREIAARFDDLDRAERLVADQGQRVNEIARQQKQAEADIAANDDRLRALEVELSARKNAVFGLFKRNEAAIERDLRTCATRQSEFAKGSVNLADTYESAREKYGVAVADRDRLRRELASEDRQKAISLVKFGEDERGAFVSELREIETKISALKKSILAEARVVGTTCTKAYLSVREVGHADVVIIDEASMVMLPLAWFVAGLSRERVVISGDFRQIPPIIQSEQEAIVQTVGLDAFSANQIEVDDQRLVHLSLQYRMDPLICDLISGPMYSHRLTTAAGRDVQDCIVSGVSVPTPFDAVLTVIDTSDLWPFETQTAFFSRFNLMHALLARNLAWHLREHGAISSKLDLGICTPYAAQAKLIQKLTQGELLDDYVQVGTVHRFQGDERRMMLLDIPESYGGAPYPGRLIQGIPQEQEGARLINVAVSRAQCRLFVMANLTYLDKKLPSGSLLRSILFDMQEHGHVVSGVELLALRPIESDLAGLIHQLPFEQITETLGIFDEAAFERAIRHDISMAKESVVIYSGYVTPSRAGQLGDLFRSKILEGVSVRCVTRPPQTNGSIPRELGREALDMLEGIGVTVDCRAKIHQKVCLIDNRIVWQGSLNALSHAGRADETMTRAVDAGYGAALAAHMSKRRMSEGKAAAANAQAENPRCPVCGSRTIYHEGKHGPYYTCESECGWKGNQRQLDRGADWEATERSSLPKEGPPCPLCGSPTRHRAGRYGPFYGCTNYPDCKGTIDGRSKNQPDSKRARTKSRESRRNASH